jgi:hypothetical protein
MKHPHFLFCFVLLTTTYVPSIVLAVELFGSQAATSIGLSRIDVFTGTTSYGPSLSNRPRPVAVALACPAKRGVCVSKAPLGLV